MTTDKNKPGPDQAQPQTAQNQEQPRNPFRDTATNNADEPSPEEEANREQQLKEAMTERD